MTDAERSVLKISGSDRHGFLQGLVTNDVPKPGQGLVYAALLTPQGKYISDFFLFADDDAIFLDVATPLAASLAQRLTMYRLRADVQIEATDLPVARGIDEKPKGAFDDPRHPALGWRAYQAGTVDQPVDWPAIRVQHCIPESGIELTPDTYILEVGFERLHGVDFRKGCYVGQEIAARMKHKTELKKGLVTVDISGPAETGTDIKSNGKPVGQLLTRAGDRAIAYLRFDRAGGDMTAGGATVRWDGTKPA